MSSNAKEESSSNDSSSGSSMPNLSQYSQVFGGRQPSPQLLEAAQYLVFPSGQQSESAPQHITQPLPSLSTRLIDNFNQQQQQMQQQQRAMSGYLPTVIPPLAAVVTNTEPYISPQPLAAAAPQRQFTRQIGERERFFLFCKILFKYLERLNKPRLRQKAKAVVSECTRRNRMGDSQYSPLKQAVENRLRGVVGDAFWMRIESYCDTVCEQKGLLTTAQTVSAV